MGLLDRLRGKPSPESFAAEFIAALTVAGAEDEFHYDPARSVIVQSRNGVAVGQINLANMFRGYREAGRKERPEYLKRVVRITLNSERALPQEYELAKPDLRPRLWTRSTLEFLRLRGQAGEPELLGANHVYHPIGRHLQACLVYDWPDSVQSIPSDQLEEWKVTPYQALEDAIANLEEATEGYAAIGSRLFTFITGDSYDATRILLTRMIEGMDVLGRHVAMTPNRNALLITGTEDEEGLRMMADMAEGALTEGYPLIGIPMVLEDGRWDDWLPPVGHPLRRRFREMQLQWIGPDYGEQKKLLDELHVRTGEDVFVANFSAVKKKEDDEVVSYCVWSEGVTTLLPETNKVFFIRAGGKEPAAVGDWERVVEVAGRYLEETEHYPPRHRTLGFPDDATLEAIGVGEI